MKRVHWVMMFTPLLLLAASVPAIAQTTTVLYNKARNTLPSNQGWLTQVPNGAQQLLPTGATQLNTFGNESLQGGYARFATLDRAKGYTFRADLQLVAEQHLSNNRAGFSVILVGADRRAIELGFWHERVWAQNDLADGAIFTQGEGAGLTTNAAVVRYDIVVTGEKYCLFTNANFAQPRLKGRLRNYSSFGIPYNLNNGSICELGS